MEEKKKDTELKKRKIRKVLLNPKSTNIEIIAAIFDNFNLVKQLKSNNEAINKKVRNVTSTLEYFLIIETLSDIYLAEKNQFRSAVEAYISNQTKTLKFNFQWKNRAKSYGCIGGKSGFRPSQKKAVEKLFRRKSFLKRVLC